MRSPGRVEPEAGDAKLELEPASISLSGGRSVSICARLGAYLKVPITEHFSSSSRLQLVRIDKVWLYDNEQLRGNKKASNICAARDRDDPWALEATNHKRRRDFLDMARE